MRRGFALAGGPLEKLSHATWYKTLVGRLKRCGAQESNPPTCSLVKQAKVSVVAPAPHMDGSRQTLHRSTLHTAMPAMSFIIVVILASTLVFTATEVWQLKEADASPSTLAFMPTTEKPPDQRSEYSRCRARYKPFAVRTNPGLQPGLNVKSADGAHLVSIRRAGLVSDY